MSLEGAVHVVDVVAHCTHGLLDAPVLHTRTSAAAFATWRSTTQRRLSDRRKLRIAIARLRARHVASALRAWVDWSGRRAEYRSRLLPALARLRNRELAAALAGWRATAASSKEKRILAAKVLL